MPRNKQGCGSTVGGATTSKKRKTYSRSNSNREDSSPVRDDLTRILRKSLLPRGYPMPPEFDQGTILVNTFEECFENMDDCREEHTKVNLVASKISQSVVSLASFKGKTRLFACTGTIISYQPYKTSILTSASLVRCCKDESKIIEKLKIKVRLPNGKLIEGKLWKYDLYYNIAIVKINIAPGLCAAQILNEANVKISQSNLVAIGRGFESGELMATGGALLYKTSKLDCQELMTSTCKITKAGIGGPLICIDGKVVGMNFCDKDEAPFLPINIILKCLEHFDMFGRVVQPWLGLRIGTLKHEALAIREGIHAKFSSEDGIYVEKVCDGSPAQDSGIEVGDVITKLDEVDLFNAQQFYELILGKARPDEGMPFVVYVLKPSNDCKFRVTVNAEVVDMTKQNRWPVPKTKWLYPRIEDDNSDFMPAQQVSQSHFELSDDSAQRIFTSIRLQVEKERSICSGSYLG